MTPCAGFLASRAMISRATTRLFCKGCILRMRAKSTDRSRLRSGGDKHYANEFRIVLPDGTLRYLRAVASVTYAPNREAVRMIGVNWDITESKRAELELRLFNEVMVGREERIIELKEEVNRLAAELGQEAPYPPVWETRIID